MIVDYIVRKPPNYMPHVRSEVLLYASGSLPALPSITICVDDALASSQTGRERSEAKERYPHYAFYAVIGLA